MSPMAQDAIEARLTELFDAQARAVHPAARDRFEDDAVVVVISSKRRRRTLLTGGGAVAVAAALIIAVAMYGASTAHVRVRPPAGAPVPAGAPSVSWTSDSGVVQLSATSFVIQANSHDFTTSGAYVDVHGDPGNARHWTLELTWREHGVEMRMNMYFGSDGRGWWVDSISIYNGKPDGDWIGWNGPFFKSPMGTAYSGNVDLTDKKSGASLHIENMRLAVHPARFNCTAGTGTYAIGTSFERPPIELTPGGTEEGSSVFLVDRASCTLVTSPEKYEFTWTSADPAIASAGAPDCTQLVDADGCRRGAFPLYQAGKAGNTVLHAVAKDRATGRIVGERDFPVHVSDNPPIPSGAGPTIGANAQAGSPSTVLVTP